MIIRIPSLLRSYTSGEKKVQGRGSSVIEALQNLNDDFPGILFRFVDEQGKVREHMRVFLNGVDIEDLDKEVSDGDEIFIIQALSGGS